MALLKKAFAAATSRFALNCLAGPIYRPIQINRKRPLLTV